jgi:hypothetical protein
VICYRYNVEITYLAPSILIELLKFGPLTERESSLFGWPVPNRSELLKADPGFSILGELVPLI